MKPKKNDQVTRDEMHMHVREQSVYPHAIDELVKIVVTEDLTVNLGVLERLRDVVVQAASDKGLPCPFQLYLTKDTDWDPLPDDWGNMTITERADAVPKGISVELGWAFFGRICEPLSDHWFIAEVAKRISMLDTIPRSESCAASLRLGFLIGQWSSRQHLPSVTRGKKTIRSSSEGGRVKSQQHAQRRLEVIAAMMPLIADGHSVNNAARLAFAKEVGTSTGGNRKMWERYHSKLLKDQ